ASPDRGDDVEDPIDEGVGAEEQHEGGEGQPWEREGEESEEDGGEAAGGDGSPVSRQHGQFHVNLLAVARGSGDRCGALGDEWPAPRVATGDAKRRGRDAVAGREGPRDR